MAIREHYPPGQFCWVELIARDMSEAREFYRRLFGWQSVDVETGTGRPYAHFELEGRPVAGLGQLSAALMDKRQPANWNSYIHVEDIPATCERAVQLGAAVTVPQTQVGSAGTLAFLRDPTGAEVGLWQKQDHPGAGLHQDFHCFCWNELRTRDLERAAEFYGQLFGWEFSDYPSIMGKYYVITHRDETCSGILQIDHRWGEMPPRWMVYFAVQHVDITVDRVRQLGGYVVVHPFDIAEGRGAVVADAQGAMFDLVQMRAEPEAEEKDAT
jgi:hypothetical protein